MHLVDDIDFIAGAGRLIANILAQLADIIYAVVAGRINLHDIQVPPFQIAAAVFALIAGLAVLRIKTIHRPGKDLSS